MNIFMVCEFEDNGNIVVYPLSDFDKPILLFDDEKNIFKDFKEVDTIVRLAINPLIEQIKPFLNKNIKIFPGYFSETIPKFERVYLKEECVSFLNIHSNSYQYNL